MLHEVLDVIRISTVQIQSQCESEVDLFVKKLKISLKACPILPNVHVFMGMKSDDYARFEQSLFSKKSCMKNSCSKWQR